MKRGQVANQSKKTKTHCFLLKAKLKETISHLEISETLTTFSNSLIVRHLSFVKFDQLLDSSDVRKVEDLTIGRFKPNLAVLGVIPYWILRVSDCWPTKFKTSKGTLL